MDMLNTAVDTLSCLYLTCGCTPTLGTESINIFVVDWVKLNCKQSIKDHKRKQDLTGSISCVSVRILILSDFIYYYDFTIIKR